MSKLRTATLAAALMVAIAMQADPAAAQEVATASCPGPATSNRQFGPAPGAGDNRFAQTFTVQHTGTLTTVEFGVLTSGTAANWVVQILPTVAGTPVDGVLSSASFANPTNPMTGNVIAHPSPPLDVAPGQEYALTISRPGSDTIGVLTRPTDPCPGDLFATGPAPALFAPEGSTDEMVLTAYVTPPPPGPPSEPSNEFSFGKAKKNKRKGTAKLTVEVPGRGDLELTKTKKVKAAEARAEAAGEVELAVKPKGKAKKRLRKRGNAKVAAEVTYTPDGGQPNTESEKLKLVKK
jgi:hypothetical protein